MDNQTILNYESAAAAALNCKPKQRGPYKRGPKSTETGPVVGIHEEPITINRPNIPNRYDREALRDFYDGLSLKRAQGNFDFMMDKAEAVTEKQAFATTIYMYPPTI